jgi:hypothetical protein
LTVFILLMISSHDDSYHRPIEFTFPVDHVPGGRTRRSVFDKTAINRLTAGLEAAGVRVAAAAIPPPPTQARSCIAAGEGLCGEWQKMA